MAITTRPLAMEDLVAIARTMRAADRSEIFATRFDDDPVALIADLLAGDPIGATLAADDVPVAALGATEMWPGNWSVWMFATDRWPGVARAATRLAREVMRPALIRLGGRRAECRSAAHHTTAHRWIGHLGGTVEAVYPAYGRAGETFIGFVFQGEKEMCATPKKPRVQHVTQPDPAAERAAAGEAADQEVRRLRALSGRRSTILTADHGQLGKAIVGPKTLLGS